jgi:hypothetical protein
MDRQQELERQRRDGMVQHVADNAKGWQTVVQGGTAYVGEIHIHGLLLKTHLPIPWFCQNRLKK